MRHLRTKFSSICTTYFLFFYNKLVISTVVHHPEENSGSSVRKIGDHHYFLRNVCIRPYLVESRILYFLGDSPAEQSNDSIVLTVCNEFPKCEEWPLLTFKQNFPPYSSKSRLQIGENSFQVSYFTATSATGFLEPFTDLTGWHLLQHFFALSQVTKDFAKNFSSNLAHLHPTIFNGFFRKKALQITRKTHPFHPNFTTYWPLLIKVAQPPVKLVQVDFLKTKKELDPSKQQAVAMDYNEVFCYESLYFSSPRVMTGDGYVPGGKWWRNLDQETIDSFRERVFIHAGVWNVTSDFCRWVPQSASNQSRFSVSANGTVTWLGTPPLLLFVRRKHSRKIINVDIVKVAMSQFGFRVDEIYWEDFDVWGQVRAARLADAVIGAHGNGMTNVFWMRPGSVVAEIYPGKSSVVFRGRTEVWNVHGRTNYGAMAAFARANHIMFKPWQKGEKSIHAWRKENVVVPLEKFISVMEDMVKIVGISCRGDSGLVPSNATWLNNRK